MSKPIQQLICTQQQFEGLHEELHRVRRTATTVKVSKEALAALLFDHSKMVAIVGRL